MPQASITTPQTAAIPRCTDCTFYADAGHWIKGESHHRCTHPQCADIVTGKNLDCYTARRGACGAAGSKFNAKSREPIHSLEEAYKQWCAERLFAKRTTPVSREELTRHCTRAYGENTVASLWNWRLGVNAVEHRRDKSAARLAEAQGKLIHAILRLHGLPALAMMLERPPAAPASTPSTPRSVRRKPKLPPVRPSLKSPSKAQS